MITESIGTAVSATREFYGDFRVALAIVAAAFVAISAYSYHVQQVTVTRFGDGDEYFFAAEQMAAGQTIRAESPYVYRIALPWIVARTFPQRIEFGFRLYNTAAAAAGAVLLLLWLRRFAIHPGVAALTTVLYIADWINPARFLYYYPIYVDPPFIALSMAALLVIEALRERFSWGRLLGLTVICALGGTVRETMLLVPVAFLFANVAPGLDRQPRIPALARAVPLAVTAAVVAVCHLLPAEPRRQLSAVENALYLFRHKALFTLPLAFFMTFGPVLAVVMYDWRAVAERVRSHFYLFVFFGGCFAAGYVGGHETERYLIWGAPVMYLLVASAIERHRAALLRNAAVSVLLVAAQALAEHVFFGIPDPSLPVGDWATLTTFGEKAWGVVNRLVIVDDFSWNLWSYFGSPQFHALLLGLYTAFSALLIAYLWRIERAHPELRPR